MAESNLETVQDVKEDDQNTNQNDKPICLIMLGMAGSGKSTLVQVSN